MIDDNDKNPAVLQYANGSIPAGGSWRTVVLVVYAIVLSLYSLLIGVYYGSQGVYYIISGKAPDTRGGLLFIGNICLFFGLSIWGVYFVIPKSGRNTERVLRAIRILFAVSVLVLLIGHCSMYLVCSG